MTDPSASRLPSRSGWLPGDAQPPHPASRKRHHRWLTLPSSTLLVICIFLPTLEVCGKATAPIEWPMFWTPYVIAGLVFAAALVNPARLGGLAIALRVIIGLTGLGFAAPGLLADPSELGLAHFVGTGIVGILIATIVTPARTPESMVARCGVIASAGSLVWFAALSTDNHVLFGAYVSIVATSAMLIACAWWWLDAAIANRQRRSTSL